ncbi:MAG: ferritin family protein [Thermoplasmata archaeon]
MSKEDAVSILTDAVEMEFQGRQFYEDVATRAKHPRTRAVFSSLANHERRHAEVIAEELARIKEGKEWKSLDELRSSLGGHPRLSVFEEPRFRRLEFDPAAGEIEALKLGIEVEKKSIDYYRNAGARSLEPKAREVFNWLVGQEAGHLIILEAEYEYRSNPGYYYDNMEFSLEVM